MAPTSKLCAILAKCRQNAGREKAFGGMKGVGKTWKILPAFFSLSFFFSFLSFLALPHGFFILFASSKLSLYNTASLRVVFIYHAGDGESKGAYCSLLCHMYVYVVHAYPSAFDDVVFTWILYVPAVMRCGVCGLAGCCLIHFIFIFISSFPVLAFFGMRDMDGNAIFASSSFFCR